MAPSHPLRVARHKQQRAPARWRTTSGQKGPTVKRVLNVLLALSRAGGSLSPCDIGEQLSVTRGTVTGLLDSLERQRLVRRTPHPKDRRMLLIELTDGGRNILDRLMPEHVQGMCELLACLSESEKKAFAGVLAKIQDHLHASGSPAPAQH